MHHETVFEKQSKSVPGNACSLLAMPVPGSSVSSQLSNDLALDERESLVPPEVRVGQLMLIQSQRMKERGVDVAEMTRPFHGAQSDGVGGPDHLPAPHPTSG